MGAVRRASIEGVRKAVRDEVARARDGRMVVSGEVTHVEGDGKVWVRLAGGEVDAPVWSCPVDVRPGQRVKAEVGSGRVTITANLDDRALGAIGTAEAVGKAVEKVAEEIERVAEAVSQAPRQVNLDGEFFISLSGRTSTATGGGPAVAFSGDAEASASRPRAAELAGTAGVGTSGGPRVAFSAEQGFGDAMHAVAASELADVPAQVSASGFSWSASAAATVETVGLGDWLGVAGVESVTAAVSGEVAFSASFDGGATWLAWDGSGWSEGAMDASAMSAAGGWPAPPLRIRMEMAGGSSVNGLTVWFERS